jgi:hypothetical protein
MKLPRWLVIGLWTSIVLAVLAAPGWWWVTWPERTANEFVRTVGTLDMDSPDALIAEWFPPKVSDLDYLVLREFLKDVRSGSIRREAAFRPRSPADWIFGRCEFEVHEPFYGFKAETGSIQISWGSQKWIR